MKQSTILNVAFVINDKSSGQYDGTNPSKGNPGIGGTQYCFLALAAELSSSKFNVAPTLYHNNPDSLMPSSLHCKFIPGGDKELALAVIEDKPDVAVVRGSGDLIESPFAKQIEVPLIAWIHNHLQRSVLDRIGNIASIKQVVFCGEEQRMLAYDTASFKKSTAIFNTHYVSHRDRSVAADEHSAVYIGSIIPSKGLHRLLRIWPSVREHYPTARLDIIGSGALYDKEAKLGKLGIAEARYERKLLNYLHNSPEKYGVIFHGLLGHEKFSIMQRCAVGIPNPTALTECCPGSVLECSSLALPVVGRRKFGMVDTVVNGQTGFLVDNDQELLDRITFLFSNPKTATEMGLNGVKFVNDVFSPAEILSSWLSLFQAVNESNLALENLHLKGKYPYKYLIANNLGGKHKPLGLLRDFLSRVETAALKLR